MGFNIGISENLQTSDNGGPSGTISTVTKTQTQTLIDEYSGYSSFSGTLMPFIQWGTVFRPGRWTLKTYVDAMLNIASWESPTVEYSRIQRTTAVSDGSFLQNISTDYKANYMVYAPNIKAGVWFTSNYTYGFRVGYEIYKPFYGNEFGLKTTTINTITNTTVVVEDFLTRTDFQHYVPLDFWYYKTLNPKLSLSINVNALLGYSTRDEELNYTRTTTSAAGIEIITGKPNASDYSNFAFDVWPQAKIGMQYSALGGLLLLNGGLAVTLPHFGYLNETSRPVSVITKNASGTFENHPSNRAPLTNTIATNIEPLTSTMNIGFTLTFWPMVTIDAVISCPTYALDLSSINLIISIKN